MGLSLIKHLDNRAFKESLCYALDVKDYCDYLGLSVDMNSNEQLLYSMHEARAESKYLLAEVRQESRVWLAQHGPLLKN